GLAAADLYEQKLSRAERALPVLHSLQEAGLGGAALSERMGFAALRAQDWEQAVASFERLLEQATSSANRWTAATFLLALYRDQVPSRERALDAARVLLQERPSD